MLPRTFRHWLCTLAAAAAAGAAQAAFDPVNDDTDIFLANPAFAATRPNVLIFLDNTANWGQNAGGVTKYQGVRAALTSVLNGVVTDAFNVGLAMFVETGNPNNNVDGAYVRFGVRQMTGANKAQLIAMINALDQNGDKGNNATYSLAMSEMFNYFAGRLSYSGHGKLKTDAGDTIYTPGGRVALPGSPLGANALPAPNGTGTAQTYVSPIVDGCQKNFIVFISNGEANDNAASIDTATTLYQQQTGTLPGTIALSPSGEQGIIADEYARYMANSDCNPNLSGVQNVYTYTIDVIPATTGQGPSHTALLRSMATNGKGKYYAITDISNTSQLEAAFTQIFTEVQAVNSVFASTTLPVSVNVRGTNLNQVYIGVFRPDPNKSPRWLGNLKLYKLGVDPATDTLFLADATGAPAENAATGFISANATSFWTESSNFWAFRDPSVNGVGGPSDRPDGDLVEKGGAAQRLRLDFPGPLPASPDHTARKLYTCLDTSPTGACATTGLASTPFNTANIQPGDIGAYLTKPVVTLTSSGTTATAQVTGHGWSSGNTVRITGATPNNFNGDYTITVVDANTFTYTMATAPDATRARLTATNHQLVPGDLLCVSGATPSGYDACGVPITRIDANNVDYTPGTPQSSPTSNPGTVWGGRQVPAVIGIPGGIPATSGLLPATGFPNTIAKIVLPSHGYGAAGTTYNNTWLLLGAFTSPAWWTASNRTTTVLDANTLSIPVDSPPVSGAINAAHVIAPNHGFSTGQTVTISGSLVSGYNGNKVITKIDNNTFTFASTVTTADTSGGMRVGRAITSITHPTSGTGNGCGSSGPRDTATVTTAIAHGLNPGDTVQILGTGAFTLPGGPFNGYDGTWSVASTPSSTTFTIFNACIDQVPTPLTPAAGVAGVPVTRIDPALVDTQPGIIHWKTLNATAISPLNSATGTIVAGRPADGDTATRDAVVNWVRSQDNLAPDENANGVLTDVRASVHGDVLHSRPATINYNRYGDDNDIYVFYGSNDGIFHAVKGGISQHTSGPDASLKPGTERWGFIAKEFFGRLKRLRDQSPTISNANQKDYFFDGSIGVYQKDANANGILRPSDGDKVYLYLSLRRGGEFIYALDVTDPANPKLLWRKGRGDAGWGELGQTWSEPKVARVKANIGNPGNPENVVLIFGAGYDDVVEDINPCLLDRFQDSSVRQKPIGAGTVTYTSSGSCTISGATGGPTTFNRTRGRGILVVDAFNGNVVWQAGASPTGAANNLTVSSMTCAIPSDVTVLDKNRDGFADRVYVGDTCGRVWRADITSTNIQNWAVTQIANLSGTDPQVISDKRKFMFPPDLVFATDANGNYTAVLLGSGDREHPFDTTVQNGFFMIKDRDDPNPANPAAGAPNSTTTSIATPSSGVATPVPVTANDLFDATNVVVDNSTPSSLNGWKVFLAGGEKVVGSAVTIAGTTFFNTNQPSATAGGGACGSNLGIAREYLVGFADAAATVDLQGTGTLSIASRSAIHAGGGYLPSPVPVVVEINGKKYQAVISGTAVRQPPGTTLDARIRTYWYKEID